MLTIRGDIQEFGWKIANDVQSKRFCNARQTDGWPTRWLTGWTKMHHYLFPCMKCYPHGYKIKYRLWYKHLCTWQTWYVQVKYGLPDNLCLIFWLWKHKTGSLNIQEWSLIKAVLGQMLGRTQDNFQLQYMSVDLQQLTLNVSKIYNHDVQKTVIL